MKYYLFAILSLACLCYGNTVIDESIPELVLTGNSQIVYVAGAIPDDGTAANAFVFGRNSSISAEFSVIQGQRYRIRSRRKMNSSVNVSYNVSIDGTIVYTDWCMVPQGMEVGFGEVEYPGYFVATSSTMALTVTGAGSYDSCIDYIAIESTDDYYFDENSQNITLDGVCGLMNIPYAMPKTGDNAISFTDTGFAEAKIEFDTGVYEVYANRTVNSNGNVAYSIEIGDDYYFRDDALTEVYFNDFVEEAFIGNVTINSPLTLVKVYDGGGSYARLDYLRFHKVADNVSDVYFDQGSSSIRYTGGSSVITITQEDISVFEINPMSSVEGAVKLTPGRAYRVVSNRMVSDSGLNGYDLTLSDGRFIQRDDAFSTTSVNLLEEQFIGYFVPNTLLTNVKLDNAGSYSAFVDYVRFEEMAYTMFDEATDDLLLSGGASIYYDNQAIGDHAISFSGSDLVQGTMEVIPLQQYKIICCRKVNPAGQISFALNIDDIGYVTDLTIEGDLTDVYRETEYPGYYFSDDSIANIELFNGGAWYARFDYLYLKPSIDVYFDENSSNLTLAGNAEYSMVTGSFPTTSNNALWLTNSRDVITGMVMLKAGQLYNVYSRRVMSVFDLGDYDLFLNDRYFYHDFTQTSYSEQDGVCQEVYLKQYIPDTDLVTVALKYSGDNGAIIDYIRFEPVFDNYCGESGATILQGDLNEDCLVNFEDCLLFLTQWLNCNDPADEMCLN